MRRKSEGITILELVIVLAIIGILGGIAVVSGSTIARRQAAHGAIATFQQSVWQGATAAASRGLTVELIRSGGQLQLVNAANDTVLRPTQRCGHSGREPDPAVPTARQGRPRHTAGGVRDRYR